MNDLTTHSLVPRWRKAVLSFMVGWMVCSAMALVPSRPVFAAGKPVNDSQNQKADAETYAIKLGEITIQLSLLQEIVTLIGTMTSSLSGLFGELTDQESKRDKLLLGGQRALLETRKKATQAIVDSDTLDAKRKVMMELAAETAPPRHEYLCKATLAHQLAPTTERLKYLVERLAEKAIESMYRGPADNGMGAQYFADEYKLRCYYKTASPVDGYPPECYDATTGLDEEPARRTFIDADLSPFTLDGAVTLEVPVMETKAVEVSSGKFITVVVPKPENYNQRMWVAGLHYCFQLAGPRPSPLWGDKMKSDVGKRDRMTFSRGLAMQSAAIKNCTALLAYHTRPNASMTELVAKQNRDCSAVKGPSSGGDGILNAETIKTQFGNCEKGLSPYQAEYIENSLCKSPNHYLAQGLAKSKHYKQTAGVVRCGASWNAWRGTTVTRDGALVKAVTNLMQTKKIWSSMAGMQNSMNGEPTGYEYVARMMEAPLTQEPVQTVKAKEKAVSPRVREDVKGVPVFSDEVDFPKAVEQ